MALCHASPECLVLALATMATCATTVSLNWRQPVENLCQMCINVSARHLIASSSFASAKLDDTSGPCSLTLDAINLPYLEYSFVFILSCFPFFVAIFALRRPHVTAVTRNARRDDDDDDDDDAETHADLTTAIGVVHDDVDDGLDLVKHVEAETDHDKDDDDKDGNKRDEVEDEDVDVEQREKL